MNTTKIDTAAASSVQGVSEREPLNFHQLVYAAYPRMGIYSEPGTRVVFDALGGYEGEKQRALSSLTHGAVYEVEWTEVGQSRTAVKLRGVDGRWNSVLFAAAPIQQAAPAPVVPAERIDADTSQPWTMPNDRDLFHFINSTPLVSSLLYDLNLLPECINDSTRWAYMVAVCDHMKMALAPSRIDADKLHRDIINLPCTLPFGYAQTVESHCYELGHRDARHAAAELVSDALGGGDTDGGKSNALRPDNGLAKGLCLHNVPMNQHCTACAALGVPAVSHGGSNA